MAENMTEFTVKLADIPVRIRSIRPEMREFLRDYLTEEEAAFTLETRQEDIEQERIMSATTGTSMTSMKSGKAAVSQRTAFFR